MTEISQAAGHGWVLDEVFETKYRSVERQLDSIASIYNLRAVAAEIPTQSGTFFEYVSTIPYFVVLVVYRPQKSILLLLGSDREQDSYSLPARKVQPGQALEEAVRALSEDVLPGAHLAGFEPTAMVTHRFTLKDEGKVSDSFLQRGVAFVARLMDIGADNTSTGASRRDNARFVSFRECREHVRRGAFRKYTNAVIAERSLDFLDQFFQLKVPPQDVEVLESEAALSKYRIHDALVKPVLGLLKRAERFNELVLATVGTPARFLDASCGESSLLFEVSARGADLVVGNDVAWPVVKMLAGRSRPGDGRALLFTNHNLVYLPFRNGAFDVALCKNTLHHLQSPREFELAVAGLLRVAPRVVLVEVVDPAKRFVSRIINQYYRHFLRDAGEHFFSEEKLRAAIDGFVSDGGRGRVSSWEKFSSLHGDYIVCCLESAQTSGGDVTHRAVQGSLAFASAREV
jgi:SAM-dependent methyltransferase